MSSRVTGKTCKFDPFHDQRGDLRPVSAQTGVCPTQMRRTLARSLKIGSNRAAMMPVNDPGLSPTKDDVPYGRPLMTMPRFILLLMLFATAAQPEPVQRVTTGSDTFLSGQTVINATPSNKDLFAAGAKVILSSPSGGDVQLVGFDLSVEAPVAGDLGAAGASFALSAVVDDLSVAAASLRIAPAGQVRGNARLVGGSLVIEGQIDGALTALGDQITLNAPVDGDVRLNARSLIIGPKARIGGSLAYTTPTPLTIPGNVIDPERITYETRRLPDVVSQIGWDWPARDMPAFSTARIILAGTVLTLVFYLAFAALMLSFAPTLTECLRTCADRHPARALLTGLAGLALLFGAVPVAALTVIGLPFLPVVLFGIVCAWMLGYLLGVYTLSVRLMLSAKPKQMVTNVARLLALAIGLAVAVLLNFIPVLGWIVNLGFVLLGLGGVGLALLDQRTRPAEVTPDIEGTRDA